MTFGIFESDNYNEKKPDIKKYGLQCVAAGILCNFVVFGVGFTYGVFQEFYLSADGPLIHVGPSKVALIGTLATSITYLGSAFQSHLRKYVLTFAAMAFGSTLLSLGMILASFCNATWQFAMTQGVMFGVGGSLIYLPPIIYSAQYFDKHRGVAMGLIFAGSGFGSVAFSIVTRYLLRTIGWKWALRTLGFVSFAITLPCSLMVHPHPEHKIRGRNIRSHMYLFKSYAFHLQMFCALFQSMGYLIPLIYMSSYGVTLGFTTTQGATFIAINNGVNACSKILLGHTADYIGRFNMQLICCALSTVTIYSLWLVPIRSTYLAFVVLYAVPSGPIISLLPACLAEAFGMEAYYLVAGTLYLFRGIGNLLGSPIAGLLIDDSSSMKPRSYFNAIQYGGAALACATICSLLFTIGQRMDKHALKTTTTPTSN